MQFPFKIYLCKKMQVKVKRTITSILGTGGLWMAKVMMFGKAWILRLLGFFLTSVWGYFSEISSYYFWLLLFFEDLGLFLRSPWPPFNRDSSWSHRGPPGQADQSLPSPLGVATAPLWPAPLTFQSLAFRCAGLDVFTSRCWTSLQVNWLLQRQNKRPTRMGQNDGCPGPRGVVCQEPAPSRDLREPHRLHSSARVYFIISL